MNTAKQDPRSPSYGVGDRDRYANLIAVARSARGRRCMQMCGRNKLKRPFGAAAETVGKGARYGAAN